MTTVIWGSAGNTAWNDGSNGWNLAGSAEYSAFGAIEFKAIGDYAYSEVIDTGDTSSKTFSFTDTAFISGYNLYFRGQATSFLKGASSPDWIPAWSGDIVKAYRYVQLLLTATPLAIDSITWDSLGNIVTIGNSSDCWHSTWCGSDNGSKAICSACDGNGFDTPDRGNESCLWGEIDAASPQDMDETAGSPNCVNIASNDEIPRGSGSAGKKCSGLICVSNTLYMWLRNWDGSGDNCGLWYSTDYGVNWSKETWNIPLGYLTFINRGPNNGWSDDGYVYALSNNGTSAYTSYNDFVLLRCDISGGHSAMRTESNWHVWQQNQANGAPNWSSTFADRGSVLTRTGKCCRSGANYNKYIRRYMWWNQYVISAFDTRLNDGGLYIMDADKPWKTWNEAFAQTTAWDDYPGVAGDIPCNFMGLDSEWLEFYLQYDSDDVMNLRKGTITLSQPW